MSQQQKQGTHPSFFVLILVFFFWGFLAASNSIFIPFCKSHFNLTQLESQLIDFAFYSAYFIGSLILYFYSAARKVDLLNKIGYKKGIIYGLLISVFGSIVMIPAVNKERIVPIQGTVEDITKFTTEQQLQTTDHSVKIRKEAKDGEYALIVPFGAQADQYITDPQLLSIVQGNNFTKDEEKKEYSANFSTANIESIVTELGTAHHQTVTFGYFALILGALFIVALGFSLQQTAANPFAVLLGNPEQGANRLSLAGGVNSFGTTIGPIIVSRLLFGAAGGSPDDANITSINTLYILLIVLFLLAAGIFAITKMPSATNADEHFESSPKASRSLAWITGMFILILVGLVLKQELVCFIIGIVGIIGTILYSKSAAQVGHGEGWGAMKYPQLVLGMLAIFIYVGVEVSIASNMGALLRHPGFLTEHGLKESELDPFVSLFWGSLMIGRWTAAISVFNVTASTRKILSVIVPFVAYGVVLGANVLKGTDVSNLYPYVICIVIQIIGFLAAQDKPAKTLMIFGILGVAFMLFGIFTTGYVSTFAFVSGGLFCSVMWPCIYSLAITGLGKYTGQASSFLVLMILGGSLIPPVQGGLADIPAIGIHLSYIIPALCFAYVAFFAFRVKSILKSQGIDYESAVSGGH
ncbi:MFS transporter, FHS family, L-fucose permease [Chitinophaga costaii]|uniref:MFS transporter, FHS family, L-fucose permease n=1 Tax=Chitinophaga costaii TaxID=1335309 RepID=A0A1C4D968_9BACT|nr:MFS transporter [Chitinophaga costaii]SCC27907.1 MFS transporter, FHS family, L-fucose permease [Chitinophaga costaii]